MYFPIIKIIREEIKGELFDYHTGEKIKIYHNSELIKEIEGAELSEQAAFLFNEMFTQIKGNLKLENMDSFRIFLNDMFVTKIKADSQQKADIIMEIIDINTGFKPLAGFSVKSQIGEPSTLMNASGATNLIFKIAGINDDIMNKINSIDSKVKIIDRFTKLYELADEIKFDDTKNQIFKDNLEMIDSKLPEILAHAMVYRYRDNVKSYRDYIYNRNAFEDYLLNSTYLETGSTSKHSFATIYKQGDAYFINMNVQIRFKA